MISFAYVYFFGVAVYFFIHLSEAWAAERCFWNRISTIIPSFVSSLVWPVLLLGEYLYERDKK